MSKGVLLGVNGVARKVKKMFTGVDDVARKVKKGFIGVGGVARCFFSSAGLVFWGNAPDCAEVHADGVALSGENHAFFIGDYDGQAVDAYDQNLVHSSPDSAYSSRTELGAAKAGMYAVFAGGYKDGDSRKHVDIYGPTLAHTYNSNGLTRGRANMGSASVHGYAIFAGGDSDGATDTVEIYNSSAVHGSAANLSQARYYLRGGTVGDYALFAGGRMSSRSFMTVDAYGPQLVKTPCATLSSERSEMGAVEVEGMLIFAGGKGVSASVSKVEGYTANLVKTALADIPYAGKGMTSCKVGEFGLLVPTGEEEPILLYNSSGSRDFGPNTPAYTGRLLAANVGLFGLLGCGYGYDGPATHVFAYIAE